MTMIPLVDKHRLVALIEDPRTRRQAWASKAACRGLGPDALFGTGDEPEPPTPPACCALCPVADECLATALVHEATDGCRYGWWGGFRPTERERIAQHLGIGDSAPAEIDLRDTADIARDLRAQMHTIRAIADELGCSKRTVYRYLADTAA